MLQTLLGHLDAYGEVQQIKLAIRLYQDNRPRMITLTAPDRNKSDWRHDKVVRQFLETRGFLTSPRAATCRVAR